MHSYNSKCVCLTIAFFSICSSAVAGSTTAYVANTAGNNVSVVNPATGTILATVGVGTGPMGVAVTPDGNNVYVPNQGTGNVSIINTATNTVTSTITVGANPIRVAIAPNGLQAYIVNQNSNTVSIIDTTAKVVIATIPVGTHPSGVAFSPDGTRLYVTNLYTSNVSVIDTASKTVINTFKAGSGPAAVAIAPNGLYAYVANVYAGTVTVHTVSTGAIVATITGFTYPNCIAFAPNGNTFYVSNGNAGSVSAVSSATNTIVATTPTASNPAGLAVSPDGAQVYVANEYGLSLSTINTATNLVVGTIAKVGTYPVAVAVAPAPVTGCTYSISPTSASYGSTGGTGSVTVNTSAGCAWTAAGNVPWASVTTGASGTGSGAVTYLVTPNAGTSGLNGTLTIAGQTFTLTEAGITCSYSIAPTSLTLSAAGGSGPVSVTTQSGCAWTAVSNAAWVTITSGNSGSGSGTVTVQAAPNTGTSMESASLTIAGQTFTISEAGLACSYSLSPGSVSLGSSGGNSSINIATQTGCAWTAASNSAWLTITSGASGSGSGSLSFSAAANTGITSQSGSLTIAGQNFTVTEAGLACSFSLSPGSASMGASGGAGAVSVTAQSGCAWTAASNSGWISITSGASGTGSGTVTYSAAANPGITPQNGSLTIAGQAFPVMEAGLACSYSLSPGSVSLGAAGGNSAVNVTTPAGCLWSAVSNSGWLVITSGTSGNGPGTVAFSAAANPGIDQQTGSLTIAGQSFNVSEGGLVFTPIRVNCGGPAMTDPSGNAWAADNSGNISSTTDSITSADIPALYQSDKWSTGTLQYQFTVPNGSFTVKLRFAEFYLLQRGQREVNIVINGNTVATNFDILSQTNPDTAFDLTFPITVTGGQVTIQLIPGHGTAKLNALEIY